MTILLIDNYDSFTYNLYQYLLEHGSDATVVLNDRLDIEEIKAIDPDGIILSPGPGNPETSGICRQVVFRYGSAVPILGVCLGHQVIGAVYGAGIVRCVCPVHGKKRRIQHDGNSLFAGIPNPTQVGLYHSLMVDAETIPAILNVTAVSQEGVVMGVRHKEFPVEGIQFHPESILTDHGHAMISNWLKGIG